MFVLSTINLLRTQSARFWQPLLTHSPSCTPCARLQTPQLQFQPPFNDFRCANGATKSQNRFWLFHHRSVPQPVAQNKATAAPQTHPKPLSTFKNATFPSRLGHFFDETNPPRPTPRRNYVQTLTPSFPSPTGPREQFFQWQNPPHCGSNTSTMRFTRPFFPLIGFMLAAWIILFLVTDLFLIPALRAANGADSFARKQLAAISALVLAIILTCLLA